jgi:hypothetical protein
MKILSSCWKPRALCVLTHATLCPQPLQPLSLLDQLGREMEQFRQFSLDVDPDYQLMESMWVTPTPEPPSKGVPPADQLLETHKPELMELLGMVCAWGVRVNLCTPL